MLFPGKSITAGATLATLLMSSTAMADVSARDVWDNWRDYMASFGYDVSASEKSNSSTLIVDNLNVTMPLPEGGGSLLFEMGNLQFVEQGDGSVAIIMPNTMPIKFMADADGETVEAVVTLGNSGMTTIASGSPEALTYNYSAAEFTIDLTSLVVDGEAFADVDISSVISGLAGMSTMLVGETVEATQKMSAQSVAFAVSGADPLSGDTMNMVGSMTGMEFDGGGTIPVGDYSESPLAFFDAGFDISGTYKLKSTEFEVNFEENGAPGMFSSTSGPGVVSLDMSAAALAYEASLSSVAIKVSAPDIPLPIDIKFGELGYDLNIPLKASQDLQDFGFGLRLADLEVSEMIWGMLDPGQVLPRNPATLIIDLIGQATVFEDVMALEESSDEFPGELNSLTLRNLQIDMAGAQIAGTGDFVFDNSDMVSFDGMPRPEGAIDLSIVGINGLMDKLIQMGLLPEDQAMGARMMISMFSIPGDTPDALTSKIEINEQGHVSANGQRIK